MALRAKSILTVIALLAVSLTVSCVVAQPRQQISLKIPFHNIKYRIQQNVVVGDAPNHIVRVFELQYTIPNDDGPLINGLKLKDAWQRGMADIADGVGTSQSYFEYTVENGDKFFVRSSAVIQRAGVERLAAIGVGRIFGGTGKLGMIQGVARHVTAFDPKAGNPGEAEIDIEYSMSK
jgi:hypothetical protein